MFLLFCVGTAEFMPLISTIILLVLFLNTRHVRGKHRREEPIPVDPTPPSSPAIPSRPLPAESLEVPRNELLPSWEHECFIALGENPTLPEYASMGRPGEELLFEALANPSYDYICLCHILVDTSLDIDALVFGPTGIFLLDTKYWNGYITAEDGVWLFEKTHFEPGGHENIKAQQYPDVEKQWERQKRAVASILRRTHLSSRSCPIQGGLAFTYPESRCQKDRILTTLSSGSVNDWLQIIHNESIGLPPALPELLPAVDVFINNALPRL
jgi:hypothetical protein